MSRVQQPCGGGPATTTLHQMATLSPQPQTQQPQTPSYHGGRPRSAILYSTGRSVSITTSALEPTYPWDLDSNEDDVLDDDDDYGDEEDEDEDLVGESYVMTDKDKDYQHPSLETSRTCFFFNYFDKWADC